MKYGVRVWNYGITNCRFCQEFFTPLSSRQKHCSPICRFKEITKPFEDRPGECWNWPRSTNKVSGYGQFTFSTNPTMDLRTSHRLSFEIFVGEIPAGKFVCHHCDNRKCFNPKHLFAGSAGDNMADMFRKGRQQDYSKMLRGDDHPARRHPERLHRKLTEDAVRKIHGASGTHREIAKQFGIFHSSVASIKYGRTWKHLNLGSSAGSASKDKTISDIAKEP